MSPEEKIPWARVPVDIAMQISERCGLAALRTYIVLRSFDDPRRPGSCHPSLVAVADRARCPPRNIYRHLAALREAEFVSVHRGSRKEGKGRGTNIYAFPEPGSRVTSTVRQEAFQGDGECQAGESSRVTVPVTSRVTVPVTLVRTSLTDQLTDHLPSVVPSGTQESGPPAVSLPTEVVVFFEEAPNGQARKAAREAFDRCLGRAIERYDIEPVQRALRELSAGLVLGHRPTSPGNLSGYFGPILKRAVDSHKQEQRQLEEQEADRRRRAESKRVAKEQAKQREPGRFQRKFGTTPNKSPATGEGKDHTED